MEAVPELARLFASFFGAPVKDGDQISIFREHQVTGGWSDFYLQARDWKLIVENKIWDENYHFDQYKLDSQDGRAAYYGLIAAHQAPTHPNWEVRRWDEWIELLKHQGLDTKPLVAGYIAYVQEVCQVLREPEVFKLDVKGLPELARFLYSLEYLIQKHQSGPGYHREPYRWDANSKGAGWYFTLRKTGSSDRREFRSWFGILYDKCALGAEIEQRFVPSKEIWEKLTGLVSSRLHSMGWKHELYHDGITLWHPDSLEKLNEVESAHAQTEELKKVLDGFCQVLVDVL